MRVTKKRADITGNVAVPRYSSDLDSQDAEAPRSSRNTSAAVVVFAVGFGMLVGLVIGSLISPATSGSSQPAQIVTRTVTPGQPVPTPGGLGRELRAAVAPDVASESAVSSPPSTPPTTPPSTEAPAVTPSVIDTSTPSVATTSPPAAVQAAAPTDPPSVIIGPDGVPSLADPPPLLPSIPVQRAPDEPHA